MRQIDHQLLGDADKWPLYGKSEGDIKIVQSEILYHREQRVKISLDGKSQSIINVASKMIVSLSFVQKM